MLINDKINDQIFEHLQYSTCLNKLLALAD